MIRLIDFPEVPEHELGAVLKHNRSLTLSTVIFFVYPPAPAPVFAVACSYFPFQPKIYF